MHRSHEKGDYFIQIDFKKGSPDPTRVFRSMSNLIETFQNIDMNLANSVSAQIEVVLLLEEVETGSIRTWLRTVLKSVDDSGLKEGDWKKIVGNYLVKGKRKILNFLKDKKTIDKSEQISELQSDLAQLAKETDVCHIPTYTSIPPQRLVHDLSELGRSVTPLIVADKVNIMVENVSIELNKEFNIPPEIVEKLAELETIRNTAEMILLIKKPDYLGKSMWEFRHEKRVIFAKILDEKWLSCFQNREIVVKPGDALRAILETHVSYDKSGEVVAIHHFIANVKSIIPAVSWHQTSFLNRDDEKQ